MSWHLTGQNKLLLSEWQGPWACACRSPQLGQLRVHHPPGLGLGSEGRKQASREQQLGGMGRRQKRDRSASRGASLFYVMAGVEH